MMARLRPGSRITRVLLGLSLGLNIFFAAYLATQYWQPGFLSTASDTPPSILSRVAERLPRADAEILWRAYRARESQIAAAQQDYRLALRDIGRLLREPQVDAEGLRAAMDKAKTRRGPVSDLVLEALIEAVPQMSRPGREKVMEKSLR